ncbi:MAG: hypothetical protein ABI231_01820 [Candidatus Tumulicola sp.]
MNARVFGVAVVAAWLFSCFVAAVAADAATAPRHLVYSFTYGTQTDLEVKSSGIGAGGGASGSSGSSDFTGGVGDQGTITVDVVAEQPDKGLVIKVSEQAQKTRSAGAATCVVYGSTGVICDPNATVNPEEMALIRFLASNFVDPGSIDAKQHWTIQNSTPQYSVAADYTIAKDADGLMTIDENRVIKEQQPSITTTNINTTIGYDFNRTIPTSVNEYSIERNQEGMGQYQTVKTQAVLQLRSDSLAATKN